MHLCAAELAVIFDAVALQREDIIVVGREHERKVGVIRVVCQPDCRPDAHPPKLVDLLRRQIHAVKHKHKVGPVTTGQLDEILADIGYGHRCRQGLNRSQHRFIQRRIGIAFAGSDIHDVNVTNGQRLLGASTQYGETPPQVPLIKSASESVQPPLQLRFLRRSQGNRRNRKDEIFNHTRPLLYVSVSSHARAS
ncbi:hypothetical protein D3C71_1454850 [compost metagenome]